MCIQKNKKVPCTHGVHGGGMKRFLEKLAWKHKLHFLRELPVKFFGG